MPSKSRLTRMVSVLDIYIDSNTTGQDRHQRQKQTEWGTWKNWPIFLDGETVVQGAIRADYSEYGTK